MYLSTRIKSDNETKQERLGSGSDRQDPQKLLKRKTSIAPFSAYPDGLRVLKHTPKLLFIWELFMLAIQIDC